MIRHSTGADPGLTGTNSASTDMRSALLWSIFCQKFAQAHYTQLIEKQAEIRKEAEGLLEQDHLLVRRQLLE